MAREALPSPFELCTSLRVMGILALLESATSCRVPMFKMLAWMGFSGWPIGAWFYARLRLPLFRRAGYDYFINEESIMYFCLNIFTRKFKQLDENLF